MRLDLYNYILRSGSAGYTETQLRNALNLSADTVRHRRTALERTGKIIACRFMRRNKSGRHATVWMSSKAANSLNKRRARIAFQKG